MSRRSPIWRPSRPRVLGQVRPANYPPHVSDRTSMAPTEPGPARRARGDGRAGACHPAAPVVEEPVGVRRPAALREVHRDRRAGRCRGRLRGLHAGGGRRLPRQRRARCRERPSPPRQAASPGRGGHPECADRRVGQRGAVGGRAARGADLGPSPGRGRRHLPGALAGVLPRAQGRASDRHRHHRRVGSSCGRSPVARPPGIELSQWFLLAASFGSLFMAAGKRYAEILQVAGGEPTLRATLDVVQPVVPALRLDRLGRPVDHDVRLVGLRAR